MALNSHMEEKSPVEKNDKVDEKDEDTTPSPSRELDADAALGKLMKYSRWRLIIYSILCLAVNIPGTWLMLSIVFIGGEPDGFSCYHPPENATLEEVAGREKIISQTITTADLYFGKEPAKECEPQGNTSVTTCGDGYTYHTQSGPTIVTDWDLVCDRNYLSETSQVVFGAGVMVGALFIPTIADRFGRWPVQLVCQWIAIVFGVGIAFSDSITTFIVLRFFLGALREGLGLSGIVMACELFPAQMRPVAGIALQFFWSGAWMLLALLAYLIRQWRHLQIALSVISILPAAAVWFAPESVIWLVAKGKVEKAEGILQKAVKFDKDPYAPDYFLVKPKPEKQPDASDVKKENIELDNVEKPETNVNKTDVTETPTTQYTLLNIPKSRRLCIYTASMCLLWFINVVVYYGLSLGASLIPGGNRYLFFFLSGLVEIPAYGLAMVLTKTFGRRIPLAGFHAVAAAGLFGMLLAKGYSNEETGITEAALSMLGKFGITASFAILVVYANEIFPTTLRNAGFGLASTWGRLGSILAPVAVYVAKEDHTIPILLFAILALLAVFAGVVLPETANCPLPNTMEDVEGWEPGYFAFSRWSKQCAKDACEDSDDYDGPIKEEIQK